MPLSEFFKSHVGKVIDALGPSMFASIVISDLNEGLEEDFEAIIRFGIVGGVIVTVYVFDSKLIKHLLSINEVSILNVEVDIAKS